MKIETFLLLFQILYALSHFLNILSVFWDKIYNCLTFIVIFAIV